MTSEPEYGDTPAPDAVAWAWIGEDGEIHLGNAAGRTGLEVATDIAMIIYAALTAVRHMSECLYPDRDPDNLVSKVHTTALNRYNLAAGDETLSFKAQWAPKEEE